MLQVCMCKCVLWPEKRRREDRRQGKEERTGTGTEDTHDSDNTAQQPQQQPEDWTLPSRLKQCGTHTIHSGAELIIRVSRRGDNRPAGSYGRLVTLSGRLRRFQMVLIGLQSGTRYDRGRTYESDFPRSEFWLITNPLALQCVSAEPTSSRIFPDPTVPSLCQQDSSPSPGLSLFGRCTGLAGRVEVWSRAVFFLARSMNT